MKVLFICDVTNKYVSEYRSKKIARYVKLFKKLVERDNDYQYIFYVNKVIQKFNKNATSEEDEIIPKSVIDVIKPPNVSVCYRNKQNINPPIFDIIDEMHEKEEKIEFIFLFNNCEEQDKYHLNESNKEFYEMIMNYCQEHNYDIKAKISQIKEK